MTQTLDDEDNKLVVLARGARARAETASGAAVRDGDGRTYAGADVETRSLRLTGLQVALATALGSGAAEFEAAVVVGGRADDPGLATLHEISPSAPLIVADGSGAVVDRVDS
ncbi:cytidine deaminase [Gordonia sp. w5E2]|uniref:Cytidine deaminase n=1 Tax=Gordonia jacobaea TaxID=122202 RepID=A0ABR5IEG8_9ACTN|nr:MULTISPECIES: cytidine deaminase [Gordonia]KNA92001.1 cytidine deaminase [Gordonia jacobaea]MCM3897705.1 cytidine deaminase [Gordonia sputi]SKY51433.1 cytidine deaminase [Mycobacteroides abscessus subsp. abscessus]